MLQTRGFFFPFLRDGENYTSYRKKKKERRKKIKAFLAIFRFRRLLGGLQEMGRDSVARAGTERERERARGESSGQVSVKVACGSGSFI